jgi:hypothetical protein
MIGFLLKKKMDIGFLTAHFLAILCFSLLYYVQDIILTNYQDFALKYGLLDKSKLKHRSFKTADYYYYIWYAMITQTTIGYGGVLNSETGQSVSFEQQPNQVFKFLNILQMIGVIIISSFY